MSPSKRSDRKGRRRRAWAAPFVVTMALSAPACVVKEAKPAQPQPTPPASTDRDHRDGEATPPTTIANPPPPTTTPTDEPAEDKPTVIANPPPPQTLPAAPASGGTLVTRKDGTCWWHTDVQCPENATCNPPPPKQVQCPAEK